MLAFDAESLAQLRTLRSQRYVEALLSELVLQFPELLAPLPRFVQLVMVGNGLNCAAALGFTLGSTLARFVALQCATAADFFRHSEVIAALCIGNDDLRIDETVAMHRLIATVPQATWNTIRSGADIRAWFEPPRAEQRSACIAARVCSIFPELVALIPEAGLDKLFHACGARAAVHGIVPESGVAVFAAALALYGDALDRSSGPAWAAPLFFNTVPLGPEKIVALLRVAISLDTQRVI